MRALSDGSFTVAIGVDSRERSTLRLRTKTGVHVTSPVHQVINEGDAQWASKASGKKIAAAMKKAGKGIFAPKKLSTESPATLFSRKRVRHAKRRLDDVVLQ